MIHARFARIPCEFYGLRNCESENKAVKQQNKRRRCWKSYSSVCSLDGPIRRSSPLQYDDVFMNAEGLRIQERDIIDVHSQCIVCAFHIIGGQVDAACWKVAVCFDSRFNIKFSGSNLSRRECNRLSTCYHQEKKKWTKGTHNIERENHCSDET